MDMVLDKYIYINILDIIIYIISDILIVNVPGFPSQIL